MRLHKTKNLVRAVRQGLDADNGFDRKPYFCPLIKEYFLKFKSGEFNCEIRPNNHHGWNEKNIYKGRLITLSNGYGKHDRMTKEITKTLVIEDLLWAIPYVSDEHIDAVESIYGKREWLVAYVD